MYTIRNDYAGRVWQTPCSGEARLYVRLLDLHACYSVFQGSNTHAMILAEFNPSTLPDNPKRKE
jgi:hypothetical protein